MRFTLWHLDTSNLIGDFDSLDAALADVRAEIVADQDADSLVLQAESETPTLVASGDALKVMAFGPELSTVA